MDNTFSYLPVMEFTRGEIVESIHFGAAVVVRADGKIVASYADPQAVDLFCGLPRNHSKCLGLIENGGVEKFGLTARRSGRDVWFAFGHTAPCGSGAIDS